ncbi:MAG: hypothetical protein OXC95_16360 [Dehalococcoidia bacterium]|nr:hypothetical protein [Dehalococcoidia bacterium]
MIGPEVADRFPMWAITPMALSRYAISEGWIKVGIYGEYSDIYAAEGKPEIIVPRSDVIGDYELVVSDLISVFSEVLDKDSTSIYKDLTVADRDVMRVKALEALPEGVPFEVAHTMVARTRDMLVAAAYSLNDIRRVYRARVVGEVANYLNRMQLAHTESGSFSLVLISPPISPQSRYSTFGNQYDVPPRERRVTERLSESLFAVRAATENAVGGDSYSFERAIESGVSANLCEAVAGLVEGTSAIDVTFSWAMTLPSDALHGPISFSDTDVSVLREAARRFRRPEPEYDKYLSGFIYRLTRNRGSRYGVVYMRAFVEGASRSIRAELDKLDYQRAAETHTSNSRVALIGDLEHIGHRLHLQNAKVAENNIRPVQTPHG